MHMYAQKWDGKSAHKLLLYFVAIFILPTLVRKLRDETTQQRRGGKAKRNCSAGCMDLHLCSQTVGGTRAAPHQRLPHAMFNCWHGHKAWARTLSIRQRWRRQRKHSATTQRIRDIYERYAANGSTARMRHISTLKQATKEAKTKQRTRRETCKKIELTKLCILALKVSARSVREFKFILCAAAPLTNGPKGAPRREEQRYAMMIAQRIKPVHK